MSNPFNKVYKAGQGLLGGAGAIGGAFIGGQYGNPMGGAAIGAAAGAAALPVGWGAMKAVGSAQVGLARGALNRGGDAVSGLRSSGMPNVNMPSAKDVLDTAQSTAYNVGGAIADRAPGIYDKVSKPIKNYDGVMANLFEYDQHSSGRRFNLTGKGKAFFAATSAVAGLKRGVEEFEKSRLGQVDPNINTATPQMPYGGMDFYNQGGGQQGVDHAGATGDLAFALNNNRRG